MQLLARRFGKDVLLARAAQIDSGFDIGTLADMIATLEWFADLFRVREACRPLLFSYLVFEP